MAGFSMPPRSKTIPARPAPARQTRVLVLVLPRVHLFDLAGPIQALSEANGFGARYDLVFCAAADRVQSAQGLALADLAPLPEPREDDLVIVPGVSAASLDSIPGGPIGWLRQAAERVWPRSAAAPSPWRRRGSWTAVSAPRIGA